jgi:hypothetical protein
VPRISPFRILLSKEEMKELIRRANRYTLPYYQVIRAKMILLAHQGLSNDRIADHLATRRDRQHVAKALLRAASPGSR